LELPRSLLIVDDEPHVRGLVKLIAASVGVSVIREAEDGERAVLMHRQHRPDMVFMDIHMPRLDGLLALKAMRLIDRRVHVVMLTSVNASDVVRQCLDAGADGYILKNAPADELAQQIRQAISDMRQDSRAQADAGRVMPGSGAARHEGTP
jgi:DNA-binding NarL/FixJ family response regulator